MNDPNHSRQILPSTVSSASGTGPATHSRARVSVACESCKRKKCKCKGGHPCEACQNSRSECIFDETQDKRRKVATKRTIEELTSHKDILRRLMQAIRTGNDEHILEQIRQRASLADLAALLHDTIYEEGDDAESADTDLTQDDLDLSGQPGHRGRGILLVGVVVDPLLPSDTSNSDSMDVDRPPTRASDGDEMHQLQQYSDYKDIVAELQNGNDQEADDLLRQLRSPLARSNFLNLRLPVRQESQLTFSNSRTLPEVSTSIRSYSTSSTPRPRMWFDASHDNNGSFAPARPSQDPSANVWSCPITPGLCAADLTARREVADFIADSDTSSSDQYGTTVPVWLRERVGEPFSLHNVQPETAARIREICRQDVESASKIVGETSAMLPCEHQAVSRGGQEIEGAGFYELLSTPTAWQTQ